jgi:hypothetical protein
MNSELTCTDCRNVFFGSSVFGNGLGVCNICRASNEATKRFEKEMAQRERHYNSSFKSSYSENTSYSGNNDGVNVGGVTAGLLGAIVGMILMLNGVFDGQVNFATVFVSLLGGVTCFLVIGLLYVAFTE